MGKGQFERRSTHQQRRKGHAMCRIVEPRRGGKGESKSFASSLILEARTPVLALREMAEEHAADGDANLARGTGREFVVGAPQEAHHRARRRCDLLRKPRITCQLQVDGTQLPRSVEALCESISRAYVGMSAQ